MMDVRLPDGTIITNVPDNITRAELEAKLGKLRPAEQPAAVTAGRSIMEIPRQVGLTARYGLEGMAQMVEPITEPIRFGMQAIGIPVSQSASQLATAAADRIGLPSPQTANERVVGDAARLMAAGGSLAGGARALAGGAQGVTQSALQTLGSNAGAQVASAGGAGAAGGAVREAGGSPIAQAAASFAGGLAAPAALGAAQGVANRAAGLANSVLRPQQTQQMVDQQIKVVLQQTGIDPRALTAAAMDQLRSDVAGALRTGQPLDAQAVARLAAFRQTGTTPTLGMLTQNPNQITREQNLAKAGANTSDATLNKLPNLQNANSARLLTVLDDTGARNAPDAVGAGERGVDVLSRISTARQKEIDALYDAARDTSGRSVELSGQAFARKADDLLSFNNLNSAIPADVRERINAISKGEMPLTVDVAEQLKTVWFQLGKNSNDGNMRRALGFLRQALDDTPLRDASVLGRESIDAFNKARAANRAWRTEVEKTPALQAFEEGMEPDKFVDRFIVGSGASARQVGRLSDLLRTDPEAFDAIRNNVVLRLRQAATGPDGDITKFNAATYMRTLNNIGTRKLSALFEPREVEMLRSVGRAGSLMKAQPDGSAVNNSNSGAMLLGSLLNLTDTAAGKVPLGLNTTIQGMITVPLARMNAQRVTPALTVQPNAPLTQRLLPGGIASLLAAPAIPRGQDDQRQ